MHSRGGALSVIVFALLHRRGIKVTPDGWAYWQGAASIAEGHGYRFFSGEPIVTWPPLYSLYLSAWIVVAGATSVTVAAADTVLLALQTPLWCWSILEIAGRDRRDLSTATVVAICVYLGIYLPLNQAFVRADLLLYTLLPGLILATWRAATTTGSSVSQYAISALVASLMVLTHNRAFVFIGAIDVLLVAGAFNRDQRARLLSVAGLITLIPLATWFVARVMLDQADSHEISVDAGALTTIEYARQVIRSVGDLLSGATTDSPRIAVTALLITLAMTARRLWSSVSLKAGLLFALVATLLTLAAFHVVHLDDDIDPRFVLFVPAILIPCCLVAGDGLGAVVRTAIALLAIAPQAIGATIMIKEAQQLSRAEPGEVVMHAARISTTYRAGPDVDEGKTRLIAPAEIRELDERIRRQRADGLRR